MERDGEGLAKDAGQNRTRVSRIADKCVTVRATVRPAKKKNLSIYFIFPSPPKTIMGPYAAMNSTTNTKNKAAGGVSCCIRSNGYA